MTTENSNLVKYNSVVGNDSQDDHHHHEELENEQPVEMKSGLRRMVLVAASTAATLGYDVGIMAAAIQPLQETLELSSVQKELAMGALNFVAAIGALSCGKFANDHGRKYTVKLCCWIFVVGTLLMALAPGYNTLLLGRIVAGMGVGVSFVVAPVYLSEVAPTNLRGKLNTVFDVAINGGILAGYVFGFLVQLIPGLSSHLRWRIMLGLGLIFPVLVLYYLAYLPESPRWLVMKGRSEEAGSVMSGLGSTRHQIVKAVSSIEDELKQEDEDSSMRGSSSERSACQQTPIEALLHCRFSPGMKLALALGFWQQITGTEAVLYYSADFLEHAGLDSATERLLGNCFVGICKLVPELIAMEWVDKVGRRPLMLLSGISLTTCLFLLACSFFMNWSPLIVVILLCAVMASFSIGLGPFTFLVAAESLGLSERATGVTLCAAINRCTSGAVALTAVSLYQSVGSGGLFAIYGTIAALSLPFYYFSVPETAGQSLEELARGQKASQNDRHSIELQRAETDTSDDFAESKRGHLA